MIPGPIAVCTGTVMHRREEPVLHQFTYPSTQIWIDPDEPEKLSSKHYLWSHRWPAPVQIRRKDYLDGGSGPMKPVLQKLLFDETGLQPQGAVRMMTQPRMWGWLFNPITVYFLWADDSEPPVAAVLEVSNTPWKERHHYCVELKSSKTRQGLIQEAVFKKSLHVSPFLDADLMYRMRLSSPQPTKMKINIDVLTTEGKLVLKTVLAVEKNPANKTTLDAALRTNPFATHRSSRGIHAQAARLFLKGVSVVRHPKYNKNSRT